MPIDLQSPNSASAVAAHTDGVVIALRVTPGASRDGIDGMTSDAAGQTRIKVFVRAVPEKNRANTAVIKILAKYLRIPTRDFRVLAGSKQRNKLVLIRGVQDRLGAIVSRFDGQVRER